jgi:putative oxidoreductase
LILRLALGVIFFAHGAQKVLGWFGGHGLAATVSGMGQMGIPAFLAYIASFTEFLGGLGLIFGVLARLSALGILINMVVAVLKVHLANGFFMNWMGNQKGEGFEYHLLAMAIALMVLLAGPGRIALSDPERRLMHRQS